VSEFLLQVLASSTQTRFDGIHRTPEGLCQLSIAQSLDFAECQDESVVWSKVGEDAFDQFSIGKGRRRVFGARQELLKLFALFFNEGFPRFCLFANALPEKVLAMIRSDAIQPGREEGLAPKCVEPLIGFEEDLLSRIFRKGRVSQKRRAQPKHLRLISSHKIGVGFLLTGAYPLDNLPILDGASSGQGCGLHTPHSLMI